jgi:hypothetical protein
MPQWLSWGCYLVLAALALAGGPQRREANSPGLRVTLPWPPARIRLAALLAITLAGLGAAWCAIEQWHQVRVTVFQPFRMATVVRGIALVFVAGGLVVRWRAGQWLGRLRVILIAVSFAGDWLFVVVTFAELAVSAAEAIRSRFPSPATWWFVDPVVFFGMLGLGLNFLAQHDTEYGHIPLLAALGVGVMIGFAGYLRKGFHVPVSSGVWSPPRLAAALAVAWAGPIASLLAAAVPVDHAAARYPFVRGLINRCRFAAVPVDDIERLGLWCRDHTPLTARFIGPPGPKTFRLWSRRSLAFNRAASPYQADGLADWFARFEDHVDFHGSSSDFVRAYVANRHGLESRYDELSDAQRTALAVRQGATYVVAAAPRNRQRDMHADPAASPLDLLHVEGRYAVYRVRPELVVQRHR